MCGHIDATGYYLVLASSRLVDGKCVMTEPEVLGVEEALLFWDRRHEAQSDLRSGGNVGYDEATNEVLYALRLGRLIDILDLAISPSWQRNILDAGCGKGFYSRALGRFGHHVDGIDASPHAVANCRALTGPNESYAESTLAAWAPPYQYDAVVSVDVLFHIMDDQVWTDSVRNLGSLTRLGGLLVVADHDKDEDRLWSNYQKTRARSRYDAVLGAEGLTRVGDFVPYRFLDTAAGFHVFTRDA
jgi:2-polyprenyl-3-methyl-5-hydroxy-6-metoxy-1,4-benzoquinol methylase